MSVILKEDKHSELPLIVFTTCIPAAEGIALCALVAGSHASAALLAMAFTTVGMVASVAHLAKPLRAPRSIANMTSSWLSREIMVVSAFWAMLLAWLVAAIVAGEFVGGNAEGPWVAVSRIANTAASIVGVGLLCVIARAYHVSTRPAWCGWEGFAEMVACALATGPLGVMVGETALGLACASVDTVSNAHAPGMAMAVLATVLSLVALSVDMLAFKHRMQRLLDMKPCSDDRVALTLQRYETFTPRLKRLWIAEALCAAATLSGIVLLALPAVRAFVPVYFGAILCGQLLIHGCIRDVFYRIPVQIRAVAPLRKQR